MAEFQNDGISENFQPRNIGGAGGNNFRAGDWNCVGCSAHNFASRKSCFKCSLFKDGGCVHHFGRPLCFRIS